MRARDELMATAFRAASRGAYEGLADEMRAGMDALVAAVTHAAADAVAVYGLDPACDNAAACARMLHDRADGAPGAGDPVLGEAPHA